jgi:hypothetical protein
LNSMGTSSPLSLCAPYPMQSIRYSADNFPHTQSLLTRWASFFYNVKNACHNGLELKVCIFQVRDGKEGKTQKRSIHVSSLVFFLCFACCINPLKPISDMFQNSWTSSFFFMLFPTQTHFKEPVGLTHNRRKKSETWKLSVQLPPQLLSVHKFISKSTHLQIYISRALQKAVEKDYESTNAGNRSII